MDPYGTLMKVQEAVCRGLLCSYSQWVQVSFYDRLIFNLIYLFVLKSLNREEMKVRGDDSRY